VDPRPAPGGRGHFEASTECVNPERVHRAGGERVESDVAPPEELPGDVVPQTVGLPAGVQLEGDEVTPAEAVLGGVRRHVFRFAGSQAGRFRLDFALKRPWEEQATESRQVQVQVGA